MADKDGGKVSDAVSKITAKALQEFDTGEMPKEEDAKPPSRATSAKSGSARGSRPTSATKEGSRPTSAAKVGSRPTSAAKEGSRPTSAAKEGSRPTSAAKVGSRPTSAAKEDSRPTSAAIEGSRPTSAAKVGSRPTSAAKEGSRPTLAAKEGSRPTSAAKEGSRPTSAAKEVSSSARDSHPPSTKGSRPPSARESPPAEEPRPATSKGSRPPSAKGSRPSSAKESSRPASATNQPPAQPEPIIDEGEEMADPEPQGPTAPAITEGQWASKSKEGLPTDRTEGDGPLGNTSMLLTAAAEDDDDEEEDFLEDDEDYGDEDESGEESDGDDREMVVLDPDHPLMKRFQTALKNHLDKQNEKVSMELRELMESCKSKHKEREDAGIDLYGVQQELARHQMMLEKEHDEFSKTKQIRSQVEQELNDVRNMYKDNQTKVNDERKKGSELMQEVENLALRLFYMEAAKEDVRSDIAVMKRAAEKADVEVTKAESEKQKQDIFVNRLVERVDRLREDMAMYEAQLNAQTEETKAAKEALSEAFMEVENITLEKKQLFQQWNSSLIGMKRRDEAHSAMQEALNLQNQKIRSLLTEIEGYKKSITKEQEQNEKLMLIFAKTDADIATMKKLLAQCQAKQEALKNEYSTYTRMLHETEQALNRATTDKTLRTNEVNALRKQIEHEYQARVELEDMILEKMRTQLTIDKGSKYTNKLTKKMREITRDLESQMANVENDISKSMLEVSHTRTRSDRMKKIAEALDDDIKSKNDIISKSETEIVKRNAIVERKQGVIDQYNKKLELMISQAGGVELGPLEITINSLQKSIEAEEQEITELQQMWLRDQSELVRLSKDKDKQSGDVVNLKKQLTILSQKKLRIEGDINRQTTDTAEIERSICNMRNDIIKLNILLHKESGIQQELEQGNVLIEGDFVGVLKEAEMESIQMQESLDSLNEEKERLLNSLVEAERQIMLWEKKTQLARETRAAVDSEVGQGEMRSMKAEIHRMQVRHSQLMKQQERMIQEMEKAVSRRDTIVTRGDAQSKMNKKVITKGTFKRQMVELKKKVKATIQEANSCDQEIQVLREHQQDLSRQIEERQMNVQQLQETSDALDGDLDRMVDNKNKNMADLLAKQQKTKYYIQAKDNRYTRLCKTNSALEAESQKQVERMQNLSAIVDRLIQDYPHAQPSLKRVLLSFGSRALTADGN